MELVARFRVSGGDTTELGNVALYEIALDARTSAVAVLTTRAVEAGSELVLSGNHPSLDCPDRSGRTESVLLAYPRIEPFDRDAISPPAEGAWALCNRATLASRVNSLVKVPRFRTRMIDRLRELLPGADFNSYEEKYLAPSTLPVDKSPDLVRMMTRSPNCTPHGYEPRLAARGEAARRCQTGSAARVYSASAAGFSIEHEQREGALRPWADGSTSGWPAVRLRRDWQYTGGVTRAVDRLVRKRVPMVSRSIAVPWCLNSLDRGTWRTRGILHF